MCVCVCVCAHPRGVYVCVCERERERGNEGGERKSLCLCVNFASFAGIRGVDMRVQCVNM